MKDLHELPKIQDSLSYIYIEHAKIEKEQHAVIILDNKGKTPVPCASLNILMLGPGTSITHAAIKNLIENDCMVLWCGEEGIRFYAQGFGRTRNAKNIIHQALLSTIPVFRILVARKMYALRFHENISLDLNIRQLRGKEGARMRNEYKKNSSRTGVLWQGRNYNRKSWFESDSINRALSAANACLYGMCHAAIVAMGYSPALGFIHTGKQLSFVYDIADLYKSDITIPLAFDIVKEGDTDISRRVRKECREIFRRKKFLKELVKDIKNVLDIKDYLNPKLKSFLNYNEVKDRDYDRDEGLPGFLWDPKEGNINGGQNFGDPR